MQYGVLCLLPPAAMLIFALKTKKSFEALIFGTLIAYLIMYKAAFIGPWCSLRTVRRLHLPAPRGKRNTWFFQPVKPLL